MIDPSIVEEREVNREKRNMSKKRAPLLKTEKVVALPGARELAARFQRSSLSESETDSEGEDSNEDDARSPPPLPRRGKTYAQLLSEKSLGGDVRSNAARRFQSSDAGRVFSTPSPTSSRRDASGTLRPFKTDPIRRHKRSSTGSMVPPDLRRKMSEPPPLPPRTSSHGSIASGRSRRVEKEKIPTVYVNMNSSPATKASVPTGKWKVTVPDGSRGGQKLRVGLSNDLDVRVRIPAGLQSGDTFMIRHSSLHGIDARIKRPSSMELLRSIKTMNISSSDLTLNAKRRFDALRGLNIAIVTWNLEGHVPSSTGMEKILRDSRIETSGVFAMCFQMCSNVRKLNGQLRRIVGRRFSSTCTPVGPDANGLFSVVFVFLSNKVGAGFRASLNTRTVRQGQSFMYKKVRSDSGCSTGVDIAPSAVLVRVRLACTGNETLTPRGTGRNGCFVDLKFITFYLPEDTKFKYRFHARNRIAATFMRQLSDGSESSNRLTVCAGAFNYRLLIRPEKVFTTILQAEKERQRTVKISDGGDKKETTKSSRVRRRRDDADMNTNDRDRSETIAGREFWEYLYPYDELYRVMTKRKTTCAKRDREGSKARQAPHVFEGFQEALPAFPPPFPRLPLSTSATSPQHATSKIAMRKLYCVNEGDQVTPSWTDRIVWKNEMSCGLNVVAREYRAIDTSERGRHCPVAIKLTLE